MLKSATETQCGIPAGTSRKFITEMSKRRVNLHSLMLIKDGKIFCEEYAKGYDADFKHRMYSVSKTYVSAAVGIAIDEGYFTLDSKVADYFTDKLNYNPHPYILNLTVRDCLMMATPFDNQPYDHNHNDWIEDFFKADCSHRGGSIFHYDTGATLVLDELIHRTTGLHFNEYLFNKCLKYIGYDKAPECVECPNGVKWGGSGIFATTREFAEFTYLWMNGGRNSEGMQLIPEDYVKQAITKQIGNKEENVYNSFRGYGYGYQIWMIKVGFALFGMGNQLGLCCPEKGVFLICTGDDQCNDFARNYIVDALEEIILKPLCVEYRDDNTNPELSMPVLYCAENSSDIEYKVSGKKYTLCPNRMNLERISFVFNGNNSEMQFVKNGEQKKIEFGMGSYKEGIFPDYYSGIRIGTPMDRGYRTFACGVWDKPDLLVIKLYAADMYFGNMTINVRFSDDGIDMHFTKKAEWFFEDYVGFCTGTEEDNS